MATNEYHSLHYSFLYGTSKYYKSGSATLKVIPDAMRIRIEANSHFASNKAAYEQAKANSLQVLASLKNVGLDETLAKTINFDISKTQSQSMKKVVGLDIKRMDMTSINYSISIFQ